MTTLREAAQAALRIIELRRNLGNAEYDKQAEQAANDLRAVLAVESVRSALAEFDASLTDPTKISVHQTAEPAQPVAWRSWTGQCGYGYWESQTDADLHSDPDYRPVPLYTAPPAPADVPRLSDEDKDELAGAYLNASPAKRHLGALIEAVEAEVRRRCGVVE